MTTQLAPHRTDLPPPMPSEVSDAGHVVGWIGDDSIGFRGFANEAETMAAAWMAHRTLARQRAHRDGTRPVPIDVEPLALARDDQREAILASGRPIAALVRPSADSRSGPDSFGFEIEVPAPRDSARMRAKAFLLYRTLRRSGIRWAMWRADDRGDPRQHARHASHASHASRVARDDAHEGPARVGGRAPELSTRKVPTGARTTWRRIAGVTVALMVVAVAILLPLLTTTLVVSAVGGVAALVMAVILAATVRLAATDGRADVRQARRRRKSPRSGPPTAFAAPSGRHLAAYHATRRGR